MEQILVTAAIIRREDGRVLVTRRPPGAAQAGLWEFPGGKVRWGEPPAAALVRELQEELGLLAEPGPVLAVTDHVYDGKRHVVLLTYQCRWTGGVPGAREGQELAWVSPAELAAYPFTPPDRPVVDLLRAGG